MRDEKKLMCSKLSMILDSQAEKVKYIYIKQTSMVQGRDLTEVINFS